MAKLLNYTGSVELADGVKPKNNGDFPLMEAHDIMVDNNGKRLDVALEELANGGGGGGGTGEPGADGTCVYTITDKGITEGTSFIDLSVVSVPEGHSVKTGDLLLSPEGLVFLVTGLYPPRATIKYYTTIKGDHGIQGEQGVPGEKGADGKDGYTPIKGKDYFDGKDGKDGTNGKDGADGVGISSIQEASGISDTETVLDINLTNGMITTVRIPNGKDGKDGLNGEDGQDGADGKSAYEYAQESGYEGSASEFAEGLKNAAQVSELKIVNVREFGAKGDGTTDDTDAIQAALHSAEDLGLPLYIPAGNYLVSKTISTYTRDDNKDKQSKLINVFGAGMGTVFTTTSNFEGDYVFHFDVANTQPRMLWVHDFAIDLTVDVSGIFFREIGMKSVIENLWISFKCLKQPGDTVRAGIFCHSATVTTFQRIKVCGHHLGLDGKRPTNCGIVINQMHSTKIIDCDITFCGWGIYLSGGSNNLIENCRIDENDYGIYQNTAPTSSNILTETRAYKTEDFVGTVYEDSFQGTFGNLTIRKNRFESNNQVSIFLLSYGVGDLNYMYNAQITIADNYTSGLGAGKAMWHTTGDDVREVFRYAMHIGRCKGITIMGNEFKGEPYDSKNALQSGNQNLRISTGIEDLTLRDNVAITWPRWNETTSAYEVVKSNTKISSDIESQLNFIRDIEANQTTRQGISVRRNKPAAAELENNKVDVSKSNVWYLEDGVTVPALSLEASSDLTACQEVTFIARGNATVKCTTSLVLSGGVDFVMQEYDTLTLVCMYYQSARRWVEKSRSVSREIAEPIGIFTPSVSEDGVISWTNDSGLKNPEPVNLKGDKGDTGEKGDPGETGAAGNDGVSPTISVSNITGGHRITITDKNGTKNIDVMDGTDGEDGADGKDGSNGTNGTNGKDGANGADGRGIKSVARTSGNGSAGTTDTYTITYTDTTTSTFTVYNGKDGATGKSAYQYAQEGGYSGTEAEFKEKLAFLMGYSVFGYADENMDIILKGNIKNGAYLKLEMEDGSLVTVGQAVFVPEPTYTNLANPNSSDWMEGYRLNSSGEPTKTTDGNLTVLTHYIDCVQGDVIRIKGLTMGNYRVALYSGSTTKTNYKAANPVFPSSDTVWDCEEETAGVYKFTIKYKDTSAMRFTGILVGTSNDVIITKNEPIA